MRVLGSNTMIVSCSRGSGAVVLIGAGAGAERFDWLRCEPWPVAGAAAAHAVDVFDCGAAAACILAIFCSRACAREVAAGLPTGLLMFAVEGDAGGLGVAMGREKFRLRVLSLRSSSSATSDNRFELRFALGGG